MSHGIHTTVRILLLLAVSVGQGAAGTPLAAQAPPGTDIHLLSLSRQGDGVQVADPRNVTQRPGYDNQPSFLPDGSALLYTAQLDGQTDIHRFDIGTGRITRVTETAESEYSPTVTPDGQGFSVIQVEADGTQRLWRFTLDGEHPEVVLRDVMPVGYHAWGDPGTLVLFVLGEPATLQVANARTGSADVRAEDVGRSLHPVPGRHAVSFTHREGDETWIKELSLDDGSIRALVRVVEGSQDYAWTPDGVILMGSGAALYSWHEGEDEWTRVVEFEAPELQAITRLAVSPDGHWLALVSNEPEAGEPD